jgi:talin
MLDASSIMIRTAKSLSNQPTDAATWQKIADNSRIVSESIKTLVATIRDEAPGQIDLESAIKRLNELIQQVDAASLAAVQQQLPRSSVTEQRVHQQILHAAQTLNDKLEPFRQVSKFAECKKLEAS